MLTLYEARKIRKRTELKTLLLFLIPTAVIAAASYFIFTSFTLDEDVSNYYKMYYLVPLVLWGFVIKKSGVTRFFQPKEFVGSVIKVEVYRAEERKTKSGGFDALQDKSFEAELMVKNDKNKVVFRVYPNGDATNNLREGDTVALLRFVNEPVVIKGMYRK